MNVKCPLTSYVLVGFSQGAVIAGDIASDIGNGRGPVDDDLVLGVTLIADGRRQQGVGQDVGPNPPGEGAEIILHEVPVLSNLGLTMTGARPGGFGALDAKTNEICGPGDLICAAPPEAFSLANLPRTLDILAGGAGQPVHALYATTQFWSLDGQPSTEWTLNWAHNAIAERAPSQTRVIRPVTGEHRTALRHWSRLRQVVPSDLVRGAPPTNIKRNLRAAVSVDRVDALRIVGRAVGSIGEVCRSRHPCAGETCGVRLADPRRMSRRPRLAVPRRPRTVLTGVHGMAYHNPFIDKNGQIKFPDNTDLVRHVEKWAKVRGDQLAYRFLDFSTERDGVAKDISWSEFGARNRAVGARLQQVTQPGDRVAILCPQSLDYLTAFFGTLYAGRIAVPLFDPAEPGHVGRLHAVLDDCTPSAILTTSDSAEGVRKFFRSRPAKERPRVIAVDAVPNDVASTWEPILASHGTVAYLQYTSGSTRTPTGVEITHLNLPTNVCPGDPRPGGPGR